MQVGISESGMKALKIVKRVLAQSTAKLDLAHSKPKSEYFGHL